ncbi:hypothetical protein RJ639_032548 [Escallonia herrerae]|uniref:Polygalacturonase n=1 Tax=Escallonia herrerae TaxID=1293975 RepID=A0AA88WWS3_9ASTE|nr:hypothetical protein RJ639_032548 [Escallonia herrerae]
MVASAFLLKVSFVLLVPCLVLAQSPRTVYDVRDHGAIGDGHADDTNALVKAWEATCNAASPSTMRIPSTMTLLTHPLSFKGPCNHRSVSVEINGDIIGPSDPSDWRCGDDDCDNWIQFKEVDGLSLFIPLSMQALKIRDSDNVRVTGLSFKNNPRMHVVFDSLRKLYVSNITIDAPEDSPNTDGIHISGCTDVFVDHCRISTGDDCISIVDGSKFVQISNITCGPGHGISIGSLGKHGSNDQVEYVQVSDVVFTKGATNGARIKTWQYHRRHKLLESMLVDLLRFPRKDLSTPELVYEFNFIFTCNQGGKGYARHILFERILSQGSKNPVIIDQFYCDHEDCKTHKSAVHVSNVTFRQILGTSMGDTGVKIDCSATVPCTDIVMDNIYLRTKDGKNASSQCSNANGRADGKWLPSAPCLN